MEAKQESEKSSEPSMNQYQYSKGHATRVTCIVSSPPPIHFNNQIWRADARIIFSDLKIYA